LLSILPPYMRRSKSIETLLPILYLKGISTGDFSDVLAALLGKDAAGLSASAIGRLKDGWLDEYAAWQKLDLNSSVASRTTRKGASSVPAAISTGGRIRPSRQRPRPRPLMRCAAATSEREKRSGRRSEPRPPQPSLGRPS
jgi:hypothetical protein